MARLGGRELDMNDITSSVKKGETLEGLYKFETKHNSYKECDNTWIVVNMQNQFIQWVTELLFFFFFLQIL